MTKSLKFTVTLLLIVGLFSTNHIVASHEPFSMNVGDHFDYTIQILRASSDLNGTKYSQKIDLEAPFSFNLTIDAIEEPHIVKYSIDGEGTTGGSSIDSSLLTLQTFRSVASGGSGSFPKPGDFETTRNGAFTTNTKEILPLFVNSNMTYYDEVADFDNEVVDNSIERNADTSKYELFTDLETGIFTAKASYEFENTTSEDGINLSYSQFGAFVLVIDVVQSIVDEFYYEIQRGRSYGNASRKDISTFYMGQSQSVDNTYNTGYFNNLDPFVNETTTTNTESTDVKQSSSQTSSSSELPTMSTSNNSPLNSYHIPGVFALILLCNFLRKRSYQ